jgi:hypothetical protein
MATAPSDSAWLARELLSQADRHGVEPNTVAVCTDRQSGVTVVVIGPETDSETVDLCIRRSRGGHSPDWSPEQVAS